MFTVPIKRPLSDELEALTIAQLEALAGLSDTQAVRPGIRAVAPNLNLSPVEASQICLRRAIGAALRFAGYKDDVRWIPPNATIEVVEEIVKRYDLEWYGPFNALENFNPYRPAVLICDTGTDNQDGEPVYHAIFCSDTYLANAWNVTYALLGWERLRFRNLLNRFPSLRTNKCQ